VSRGSDQQSEATAETVRFGRGNPNSREKRRQFIARSWSMHTEQVALVLMAMRPPCSFGSSKITIQLSNAGGFRSQSHDRLWRICHVHIQNNLSHAELELKRWFPLRTDPRIESVRSDPRLRI